MDQGKLALDYLRVVIWPALALAFFWLLRQEIRALLTRVRKAHGFGFDAETWPPTDQSAPVISDLVYPSLEEVVDATEADPANTSRESSVEKPETRVGDMEPKSQSGLDKSQAELYLLFERVYRLIFGTQIQLLHLLNVRALQGASLEELSGYWNEHNRASSKPLTFDAYVDFLTKSGLILADEIGEHFHISQLGSAFLQYLIANGMPFQKPY